MAHDFEGDGKILAKMVREDGNDILLLDGRTKIKAIVDERPDEMRKSVTAAELEKAQGRVCLFFMTPADFAKIPSGSLLTYDGESFDLRPVRSRRYANITTIVSVLGATGGYS